MEELSRIYFSSPVSGPEKTADPPPALVSPAALVPVADLAGPAGCRFLGAVRGHLEERGFPSVLVELGGRLCRVEGEQERLTGPDLIDRIRVGDDPPLLFLRLPDDDPGCGWELFLTGDASILLVDGEIDHLVEAYRRLKSAVRTKGTNLPAIVPVAGGIGTWEEIASIRLAEAATRFLSRRLPVWGGGDAERVSSLLAGRLSRMLERKERGVEPLLRRLAPVLGGAA